MLDPTLDRTIIKPQVFYYQPEDIKMDDRGYGIYNVYAPLDRNNIYFDKNSGQSNESKTAFGVKRAWHLHKLQTDCMRVSHGNAKIVVFRLDGSGRRTKSELLELNWYLEYYIGDLKPGIVVIPPGWYHGFTPLYNKPCVLNYYVSHIYNPTKPDEHPIPYDQYPFLEVENR
ncbi:MAG TPA: hypothetical protein VJJ80_01205 [Patescibacteria group bacterium]|nr:hypothetical protein [Patescibacteria group bacterium]